MSAETVAAALTRLFTELVEGAPGKTAFVLNGGDAGLLRSLDALPAAAASRSTNSGATIAAHVDHLLYGLTLMNRWRSGENPWDEADWTLSWRRTSVSDDEWRTLRAALAGEARRWLDGLRQPREMSEADLTGVTASVVHLAYHLGAIRQIDKDARGPRA
jgi:hypothetical protein